MSDLGCDAGLFLRSNERAKAYQVMIDYLEGGMVGGIFAEGLKDVKADNSKARQWPQYSKKDRWNQLLAQIGGEAPHIRVWLNGTQIVDWTDTANDTSDGAIERTTALQTRRVGKASVGFREATAGPKTVP